MPTKLNTEFNYRYQVIGETVWEKIKTLKGFYEGRIRTSHGEKISEMRHNSKLMELQSLKDSNALPHVILNMEADILEFETGLQIQIEAFELNRQEIKILENLLAECYEIAEPTRIKHLDGTPYTDEEMFEANAANEFTAMIGKEIYAEVISTGLPSPTKLRNAMSNPHTWKALQQIGLIPEQSFMLAGSNDPLKIGFEKIVTSSNTNQLIGEVTEKKLTN
jgi:hypothetical protein